MLGAGSNEKLGRFDNPIGMGTDGSSGASSSSVLKRPESLRVSRTGAETRDRIFPTLP